MWCVLEGAIAGSLIIAGGLLAIQMASIVVGLPIAVYMLLTAYTLCRSLLSNKDVIDAPAVVETNRRRSPKRVSQ